MSNRTLLANLLEASKLTERDRQLGALRNLARKIFLDRNMRGAPRQERLKIKAEARPLLRRAIHWTRKSRDALIAGEVEKYELLRDRARMFQAFAILELFQPYANRQGRRMAAIAARSREGAEATADKYSRPKLDDLILGCLERGDQMPVKAWEGEFKLSRSAIYRRINRLKGN